MNVQVRLRVQRAHLAAAASLNYWAAKVAMKQAEHDAALQEEVNKLLLKKTWCGGYKYNEASAKKFVSSPPFEYYYTYSHLRYMRAEIKSLQDVHKWLTDFVQSTKDKEGFMVILTQEQYNWIWDEV